MCVSVKLRSMNKHSPSNPHRLASRMGRLAVLVAAGVGAALPAFGQKLFYENFDSLPLGPNVEEASAGAHVWTKTPPTGWSIDDTGMPGYDQPDYADKDGRKEWAGWSFADAKWWPTVDDQRRSEFVAASGTVAVADDDEWDDATHYPGLYNSLLSSPEIPIAGKAANSLVLVFDSSWRPECCDDGAPNFPVDENGAATNDQTAVITAQYDGGTPVEILRWDSKADSPTFHDHLPNEPGVLAALNNPAAAQKVVLKFGLLYGANDWWWAIDNVAVGEPPLVAGITATGVGVTVRIAEALGKTVNDSAPITATLDGQTITVTSSRDGETVVVSYDQSPNIFVPGSQHDIQVSFTTGDGRQVTDGGTFKAPTYVGVSSTPSVVTATINETDYLTVDESKGVQLALDGNAVTAGSVQRVDLMAADGSDAPDQIVVKYTSPAAFDSASTHSLKLTFTTATAQSVVQTNDFVVATYETIPAALGTAAGTGADAGMRWRTHQLAAARPGGDNIAEVERQLSGQLGDSIHDPSSEAAGGYFQVPYVNFEQSGIDAGSFNVDSTVPELVVQDDLIPGIPGLEDGTDNIAGEARTFIEFPNAGVYTMGVNSDDGFQVSTGTTNNPTYQVLGQFDAGRGAADTVFYFKVQQAGVYFFRLLYFEGGGGASVEWFTINDAGQRALVNGPDTGTGVTALKSYERRTVAEPDLPSSGGVSGIALQSGQVVIQYTGTLKSADLVGGPYTDVTGATSPYSTPPAGTQKFFIAQ